MRGSRRQWRRWLPWGWMLAAACLLTGLLPASHALWAKTLGVSLVVHTGQQTATPPPRGGGAKLKLELAAAGFWERATRFGWSLELAAEPASLELSQGQTGSVTYTLTAARSAAAHTERFGVRGEACVTNHGQEPTEGLTIDVRVLVKAGPGGFRDLPGASQTLRPPLPLGPNQTECYPAEIEFTPVPGGRYRLVARATILNHPGHRGEPFGPERHADFSLPDRPATVEASAAADMTSGIACPAGFICTSYDAGPWHMADTTTAPYRLELRPESAACGTYALEAAAALVEAGSGQVHNASAVVAVTLLCPPPEVAVDESPTPTPGDITPTDQPTPVP